MKSKIEPPEITEQDKNNFKAIGYAAETGRLGLLSCLEKGTGKPIMVLVAKNVLPDGSTDLAPLGTLFTSEPTDFIEPPSGWHLKHNGNDANDIQQHSE